jgi:hypothetical protein
MQKIGLAVVMLMVATGCSSVYKGPQVDFSQLQGLRATAAVPPRNVLAESLEATYKAQGAQAVVRAHETKFVHVVYPGTPAPDSAQDANEKASGNLAPLVRLNYIKVRGPDQQLYPILMPGGDGNRELRDATASSVCQLLGYDHSVNRSEIPFPSEYPDHYWISARHPYSISAREEPRRFFHDGKFGMAVPVDPRAVLAPPPAAQSMWAPSEAGLYIKEHNPGDQAEKSFRVKFSDPTPFLQWKGTCQRRADGQTECTPISSAQVMQIYAPQLAGAVVLASVTCTNADPLSIALVAQAKAEIASGKNLPALQAAFAGWQATHSRNYEDEVFDLLPTVTGPVADKVREELIMFTMGSAEKDARRIAQLLGGDKPSVDYFSGYYEDRDGRILKKSADFGYREHLERDRAFAKRVFARFAVVLPPCQAPESPFLQTSSDGFVQVCKSDKWQVCSPWSKYSHDMSLAITAAFPWYYNDLRSAWMMMRGVPSALSGEHHSFPEALLDHLEKVTADEVADAKSLFPLGNSVMKLRAMVEARKEGKEAERAALEKKWADERAAEEAEDRKRKNAAAASAAAANERAKQAQSDCVKKCLAKPGTNQATCNSVCK